MFQRIVCWMAAIALLCNNLAFAQVALDRPDRQTGVETATAREEAEARLDELIDDVEQMRAAIDRSQFDLDTLLDKLEFEAEDIIRFVQEEIAFEQYPGLLRGARGTLVSRAGNALDQSVLLATLLKDAGYEARIVRGVLSEEQGRLLLAEMKRPRMPAPPPFKTGYTWPPPSEAETDELPAENDNVLKLLEPANRPQARRRVAEIAQLLVSRLQDADLHPGDPGVARALADEVGDYFWVEHRSGPTEPWRAIHPAQGSSVLFPDPNPVEYFVDEIPPSLQHRVRFQVFIEQKFGTEILVHPITPGWERPAANVFGRTLSYSNYPNGLETEADFLALDQRLEQTQVFIPLFNGDVLQEGSGFDLNGIPFELDSMGMDRIGATGLFRQVGNSFERAAAALGGLSDDGQAEELSDLVTLTAEWIDYTLVAPGGKETHYRKYLLDRIGPDNRMAGRLDPAGSEDDFKSALLVHHDFLVMPGAICDAFYLDQFTEELLNALSALRAISRIEDPLQVLKAAAEHRRRTPLNLLTAAYAFDVFQKGEDRAAAYRSEPGLIVYQFGLGKAEGALAVTESVDIVHSRRRSTGDEAMTDHNALMQAGIWETLVEGVAIGADGASRFDTWASFQGLSGDDLAVITPGDSTALQTLGLTAEDEYHVRQDLDQGYVVVAPRRLGTQMSSAWWRIDPDTGEALGRISGGRGGALIEHIVFLTGAAVLIAVVAFPAIYCLFNKDDYQGDFGCCFPGEVGKMFRAPAMVLGWTKAVIFLNRQIGDMQRCGQPPDPGPPPPTR